MDILSLIIIFIVLMFVICGGLIFLIRKAMFASTESALSRLTAEIEKANAKQAELTNKLKKADEELTKRRAEAKALTDQMKTDAEEQSKEEREKIINQARAEGEEIIEKAQNAKDKIRQELEKENDLRTITYSIEILNSILSEKAKGSLDSTLVSEFVNSLRDIDMTKISPDIKSAELVTLTPIDESVKSQISQIIKEKTNRDIALESKVDENLGGGILIKFGSMALDGSIKQLIRQEGTKLAERVETE